MNKERFPQLLRSIYDAVDELERMFPDRHFTPDGHLVGSLGEALASFHYGIVLDQVTKLRPSVMTARAAIVGFRSRQHKATALLFRASPNTFLSCGSCATERSARNTTAQAISLGRSSVTSRVLRTVNTKCRWLLCDV